MANRAAAVRRRRKKADVKIARVKRKIKSLSRQLRRQQSSLSKQVKARGKIK